MGGAIHYNEFLTVVKGSGASVNIISLTNCERKIVQDILPTRHGSISRRSIVDIFGDDKIT